MSRRPGPDRIFEVADAALYEAKRQGRNRVHLQAPEPVAEPVLA